MSITNAPTCPRHPDLPATEVCPRCGGFTCSGCLVTRPDRSVVCSACAAREPRLPLPWDRRVELGTVAAFGRTVGLLLRRPIRAFAEATPAGPVGGSLSFAALCAVLGNLPTLIWTVVRFGLPRSGGSEAFEQGFAIGYVAALALVTPLVWVVVLLVVCSLDHAFVRLLGGPPGWSTTLRGASLAMVAFVVGIVPTAGHYLFVPAWALMRIFAYRGLHGWSGGRATLSVLLPVLVFCVCLVVPMVGLYELFSRARP